MTLHSLINIVPLKFNKRWITNWIKPLKASSWISRNSKLFDSWAELHQALRQVRRWRVGHRRNDSSDLGHRAKGKSCNGQNGLLWRVLPYHSRTIGSKCIVMPAGRIWPSSTTTTSATKSQKLWLREAQCLYDIWVWNDSGIFLFKWQRRISAIQYNLPSTTKVRYGRLDFDEKLAEEDARIYYAVRAYEFLASKGANLLLSLKMLQWFTEESWALGRFIWREFWFWSSWRGRNFNFDIQKRMKKLPQKYMMLSAEVRQRNLQTHYLEM